MTLLRLSRHWFRRYGVQHLAAEAALIAVAILLAGGSPAQLGVTCAGVELLVFYGVAYLWHRRAADPGERTLVAMCREYGPAELLDLLARPLLIAAGASLLAPAPLGVVLGSAAADLLFYAVAALRCARSYGSSSNKAA